VKGETRRVALVYRTKLLEVAGAWFEDDSSYYVKRVELVGDTGDCWPLIEGTAVAEELTAACREILLREDEAHAAEMKATGGLGESYAEPRT
jgi:hypothetical protein